MASPILSTTNLSKHFSSRKALSDVTLELQAGRIIGLFGENGAGKTTFMKIITNQIKATSGSVFIKGEEVVFNKPINTKLACLLENPNLYPQLTARQHLKLFAELNHFSNEEALEEIIDCYELADFMDLKAKKYSLGMKQRLGLAIAELSDAELVVLDEPFNGLDPMIVSKFRKRLQSLKAKGKTIIISSHLVRELEDLIDDLVIISHGRLIHQTSYQDFLEEGKTFEEKIISLMENLK